MSGEARTSFDFSGLARLELNGAAILKGARDAAAQAQLLEEVRACAREAPPVRFETPSGRRMSVAMTSRSGRSWARARASAPVPVPMSMSRAGPVSVEGASPVPVGEVATVGASSGPEVPAPPRRSTAASAPPGPRPAPAADEIDVDTGEWRPG